MVFTCSCGFQTCGDIFDLLGHIRGHHDVDVHCGKSHYAHCNEDNCLRTNGHGRRLNSFYVLQAHLEETHQINIDEE